MYIVVLLTVITLHINYHTRRGWHISEVAISFVLSVPPSAWNNSSPMERIFMKLGIFFFENLWRKFTFHSNLTTITGTLHEDR